MFKIIRDYLLMFIGGYVFGCGIGNLIKGNDPFSDIAMMIVGILIFLVGLL